MTAPLLDPQLEALYEANPELLRPDAPPLGAKVPAWYDNTVVELAAAFLIVRGFTGLMLRNTDTPNVRDVQTVAGQAWRHNAPTWMQFAVPAIQQAYGAGRITGMTDVELEAMATDYAEGLGDYLNETSAEVLAEGFTAQVGDRWDPDLAWYRASTAYGVDGPSMRTYLKTVLNQGPGHRDPVGTAARMLVDRSVMHRADVMAQTEAWSASQSGLAISWLVRQRKGQLGPNAARRWHTRHGETVCAVCGPMDGQTVLLEAQFTTPLGTKLLAPGAHPECQCSMELVEEIGKLVSKSKTLEDGTLDPYNRTQKGQFARQEARTRDVTYLVMERDPEVQAILDQVDAGVANPFGVVTDAPVNPFGAVKANPFATANPFGVTANPFAEVKNPFVATGAKVNPFDDTKRQTEGVKPKRKLVIHHIFMPAKSRHDEHTVDRDPANTHYASVNEWVERAGFEHYGSLVHPGDRFNFDAAGFSPDDLDDLDEVDNFGTRRVDVGDIHGLAEGDLSSDGQLDGGMVAFAPKDGDIWHDEMIVPDMLDQITSQEPDDIRNAWSGILSTALPLWNGAINSPRPYLDKLTARQLAEIYEIAGYEDTMVGSAVDDDFEAAHRIEISCGQHGLPGHDDSLAEAFADYVTWTVPDRMGEQGKLLASRLEEAVDEDLPPMGKDYDTVGSVQVFAFDRGFHPYTEHSASGREANLDADYVVHHVIYRSNLGENGTGAVPFVAGVREASLWPADNQGHPLFGAGYPDPPS